MLISFVIIKYILINELICKNLNNLKNLGRQGDVTARLDSGEIIELKAKYAIRKRLAIVAGQETEAEIIARRFLIAYFAFNSIISPESSRAVTSP